MNATQLGHRAAAQLSEAADLNPFDFKTQPAEHDAWLDAYAKVVALRKDGLDPSGHQPPPPHLCTRNAAVVCNCCSTCTTECWCEKLHELPTGRSYVRKLVKKVLW